MSDAPIDPDGDLMERLEREFAAVLEGPERDYERGIAELCDRFPDHAAELWRWLARVVVDSANRQTAPPPTSMLEPTQIGSYTVIERLGRGGMGAVYLAEHAELGRRVALKMIRAEFLDNPIARRRFRREVVAASRLEHPHICQVFEVAEESGVPFMAMQYVDGETLAAHIRRQAGAATTANPSTGCVALPEPVGAPASRATPEPGTGTGRRRDIAVVVAFVESVARAMHYAHENGLVHRDLKPANIMVTVSGDPVILDFGLVRDESAGSMLSASGDVLGTLEYMAPEQIEHGGRLSDRRTDVYALGVTLYECLCLEVPFRGASQHEVFEQTLHTEPPSLRRRNRNVPRDLELVVTKALEKEPERRYHTAEDFADDLRRWRELEPVVARPSGPVLKTRRWIQRNPWAALLLLAVTAGLGVSLLLLGQRNTALGKERSAVQQTKAALDDFDRLAVVVKLRKARELEQRLYPGWPDRIDAMRQWQLEHAAPLAAMLPDVRETLERLATAETAGTGTEASRFLLGILEELEGDLAGFCEGDDATVAAVARRLAWAGEVGPRSIGAHLALWKRTAKEIAADDRYGGLELEPQMGLVPLGRDPQSRLFEFYHLRSAQVDATIPARDPASGELQLEEGSGIVFVLVPGDTFLMGAQARNRSGPNYDPDATAQEAEPHSVELSPFFLGKTELTQSQWKALSGGDEPSYYRPGKLLVDGRAVTGRHPTESVDWPTCDRLLFEHGLALPTEAQWEYACRGGSSGPAPVEGHANVSDLTFLRTMLSSGAPRFEEYEDFDDGYFEHAPAGHFAPNGFGLHDMLGNVWEWCRDWVRSYELATEPGTGLRLGHPIETPADSSAGKVIRGGSLNTWGIQLRCTHRWAEAPSVATRSIGLRAARRIL